MRRNRDVPAGEVRRFTIESRVLAGNRLGDPTSRALQLYLPALLGLLMFVPLA